MKSSYRLNSMKMVVLFGMILLLTLALAAKPVQAAVLWDQPLSEVNLNAYVDQDFTDLPGYSSFLADDFTNATPWSINKIFVPGNGWNGFSTLLNATSLNFLIYSDNSGIPAGYPGSGSAQWSLSLAPTNPQITIENGTGGYPSNVILTLTAALNLPAGTWWFLFYPEMAFDVYGQYGRQPSDTTNGYTGQFINPLGGFGLGTSWQNWTVIGPEQRDIAFRLEGTEGEVPIPEPTTMLLLGSGLVGLAGYARKRFRK